VKTGGREDFKEKEDERREKPRRVECREKEED